MNNIDFASLNVRAQIAFGIALIAALLVYIAFFKDAQKSSHKKSA